MFIIAGPPGVGKTTQCHILEEQEGFIWISAGNLLREKATGEHREEMLRGELVDDAYVDSLVEAELDKHLEKSSKVLLDGFPRDFHEVRWLNEEYAADIKAYILLEAPETLLTERLLKRGRADDTKEAIEERLEVFREETNDIVEYLSSQAVQIFRVDGSQSVEQVHASLKEVFGL